MGRRDAGSHPWLFDRTNNLREQHAQARRRNHEEGVNGVAVRELDHEFAQAFAGLFDAMLDDTHYRHNEIGTIMENLDGCLSEARGGTLYEIHDEMEELVTETLPSCEELLFQHAEVCSETAKACLQMGIDAVKLEILHQERHDENRERCAARNKANYEIEMEHLCEEKEQVVEEQMAMARQLQELEHELAQLQRSPRSR